MRRSFTLLAVAACGIVPRVLLLRLPGLGRDEAAYLYWSHDPEFAYSPLLQVALWFADALPGAAAWTLRLPALVGGVAALVLARRLAGSARQPAVVALFLSPWWVFSSSMVHPDALLLPALLALCLARRRGHAFGVAVAASLAAWAKPSGLLAIPVALVFLADPRLGGPWRRLNAALLALSAASVVAPILRPEIFSSLREFASADPTVAWQWRWGIGLLALVLLTGPHMLAAAVGNAWRARGLQLEALLPTVFAAAFAFAALFWGQFKITWFLPAIVLWTLLPTTGRARARRRPLLAASSAALSLLLALAFARPDWTQRAEAAFPALAASYAAQAGGREREVSSTSNWSQRCREYDSLESFVGQLRTAWGAADPPQWLISDDYGLAAQILAAWPLKGCRMFLPGDGIFSRSWPDTPLPEDARILVISVRKGRDESWLRRHLGSGPLRWLEPVPHPLDRAPVELGMRRPEPGERRAESP